ncbi:DEAD/DEAH box helicase [Methylobacterium sp. E-041]|uniref:DEAD/DEAH box helicase n=1 Tax=Methylobacterium sp. E-041 TaxID=2836573 RepID=UPI001FB9C798|nr:DEAD/DEAH box helicase [Methylobacterium sp. E-041]MCJ2105919.1 DEAD/DEAH box helicase [Methylobacterium sp. E-041]
MITIFYVPAPTGSGKTTGIYRQAVRLAETGANVLIVQPSRRLIRQTVEELRGENTSIHVEAIYKAETDGDGGVEGSVGAKIIAHLACPYPYGQILFVTSVALAALDFFPKKQDWKVFVDEVPGMLVEHYLTIPNTHSIITSHLVLVPKGPEYGLLVAREGGKIDAISRNKGNDINLKSFDKLSRCIRSKNYDTYVKIKSYNHLLEGRSEQTDLRAWSVLKPEVFRGFASVTIAGARIQDSLLFKHWENEGVLFILDHSLDEDLLYLDHENGKYVTFYYGTEKDYSKAERNKEGDRVRLEMIKIIIERLDGQPFGWIENEDRKEENPFSKVPGNMKIPATSHGLNSFKNLHNAVILGAYNYNPETARFIKRVCHVSRDEQRDGFCHQNLYQAACRISVRVHGDTTSKKIFAPDRKSAEWLSDRFPGSSIVSLGIDSVKAKKVGRERKHENAAARKKAHRDSRREQLLSDIRFHEKILSKQLLPELTDSWNETTYIDLSNNVTRFQGTLLANKYHRVGVRLEYTNAEFVEYLKWLGKRKLQSKGDNFLISPALFVPNFENNTFRTLENVQTSNGIWFDVENGNLPYDEWPRIFPQLEMVIYSTRSHTKKKPRYRVCILTDKMMSVSVYREIWFQVKQRIIDEGYTENKISESNLSLKAHGIDNKHNPSDMFYLPCRTESGKHNVFKDIRGAGRRPLNVVDWIEHASDTDHNAEKTDAMIPMISNEEHTSLKGHQQQKIEEAKARFETVGQLPEEGDKSIWNLHLDLEKTGIDRYEHESILRNAARHTKSPSDRQAQISRLMKRKRWRVA